MDAIMRDRAEQLKSDYAGQPCGETHGIILDHLSDISAQFSKDVTLRDCVVDRDPARTRVVQGGVIAIVVDFAGVYLARMHSDSMRITPLANLQESYFKPFILGKDLKIVARAQLAAETNEKRIMVDVVIENEDGDYKGRARLIFARRSIEV